jgi:23S rRNA pseudouridine955/2504/2580 synthase
LNTLRPKPEVLPAATARQAVVTVSVESEYDGQRLDNFLTRICRGVPRAHVYQLIRSGQVRVNGRRAAADQRLATGDQIRVPPVRTRTPDAPPNASGGALGARFPILFEDEDLLVIDKPAGVAVHGGSGISLGVIEALRRQRPQQRFLELVHRLDRETSGVLVIALRRTALVGLQEQFRERSTGKTYLAIVAGRWPLRTRTIRQPLERLAAPDGDRRVRVSAAGREAVTRVTGLLHFELPAPAGLATVVAAAIETGRTHQIRVHLAHAGHSVLGDDKYGDYALNRVVRSGGLDRMYLHALRLELAHPLKGGSLTLSAPLPPVFSRVIGDPAAATRLLAHPVVSPLEKEP